MFRTDSNLQALEDDALSHLQSVDFTTPIKQLDDVFAALIEVPTTERRADTDFAYQARAALDMLVNHTNQLAALVWTLGEYVHPEYRRPVCQG